jgi:hypothetical protein
MRAPTLRTCRRWRTDDLGGQRSDRSLAEPRDTVGDHMTVGEVSEHRERCLEVRAVGVRGLADEQPAAGGQEQDVRNFGRSSCWTSSPGFPCLCRDRQRRRLQQQPRADKADRGESIAGRYRAHHHLKMRQCCLTGCSRDVASNTMPVACLPATRCVAAAAFPGRVGTPS